MTILIVDDNRRMRALLAAIARLADCDVREAADGATAVRLYQALRPNLVLMDVQMPGSGLDATREIRRRDANARVVIVTDHDDEATRRSAMDVGACAFLPKDRLFELKTLVCKHYRRDDN